MKINPNGFREYDARWLFEKDIDIEGITDLGKGLGTQIVNHIKKANPRVIVGHDYRSYSEDIKKALNKDNKVIINDLATLLLSNVDILIFPDTGTLEEEKS